MYQIESVFIGESQHGETVIKSEIQTEIISNFKVGDVTMTTKLSTNNFTLNLNCTQCSQSFQNFPKFTEHIEEHFINGDVFISNDVSDVNTAKNETARTTAATKEKEEEEERLINNSCSLLHDEHATKMPEDEMECMNDGECSNRFMVESVLQMQNDTGIKHPTFDGTASPTIDLSRFVEGITYKKVKNVYECMICGFQSAMKSNLKSHIAVHVKIKNIFCSICMKGFGSIHYLQKHIKSIHKATVSAEAIRKAQKTLKQIVKPKKSDRNGSPPDEVSKLKLNLLSSHYWRTEGKRYHCVLCVQWFKNPKYVQKHIRLVHGRTVGLDEILAAQIQPELKPEPTKSVELVTQKQIESLQREQAQTDVSNRMKSSSFECFACHTKFVSEKALRYHMPLHEGIQYKCPLCEKYFLLPKYVRDHMIYKHDFDKKSKLPPLKTRKIENFEYHKPIVSRFECYLCHRTYPSRSKLNSHMKSHLDVLECNVCSKIFKSTESRRRHLQLHFADPNLQHHCLICNKAFPVRRYLMSHIRTSHRNAKSEKAPKAPPKILTCEFCLKTFVRQGTLNKHLKCHNKEPTRYICDMCGDDSFENRHNLRRHLSSVHKISKKYFKCNVCQKIVPKRREEEHKRFHTGQKDHQCEICGSQYVTLGLLNSHKKRQHGRCTYECDVCPERFDQPKKLLHHRRSHTEPMDINCSICNLGFFNVRSLSKHEMKKHGQRHDTTVDSDSESDTDIRAE